MEQNSDKANNIQEKINSILKKNKIKILILIIMLVILIFSFFLLNENKKKTMFLPLKNIIKQLYFYQKIKNLKPKIIYRKLF